MLPKLGESCIWIIREIGLVNPLVLFSNLASSRSPRYNAFLIVLGEWNGTDFPNSAAARLAKLWCFSGVGNQSKPWSEALAQGFRDTWLHY